MTTAEALGIEAFDDQVFINLIDRVKVTAPNELRFVFNDGHVVNCSWKDRSRSESWTEEMKLAASEKSLHYLEDQNIGSGKEARHAD